jgi:hypothetical protein
MIGNPGSGQDGRAPGKCITLRRTLYDAHVIVGLLKLPLRIEAPDLCVIVFGRQQEQRAIL